MSRVTGFFMIFALAALMAAPAAAQESSPLEFKIYEIKHQKAVDIALLLDAMVPIGQSNVNAKFNTISFNGTSAEHAVIAAIIQKYDVPDVPKKTIEFQFFLVKAGSFLDSMNIKKNKLPEKVQTALNDIAGLTRYKEFELIDAPFLRTQEGVAAHIVGPGKDSYTLTIGKGATVSGGENKRQIQISGFMAHFAGKNRTRENVEIGTSLEFPEGDMVVIGSMQVPSEDNSDAAIIVIVTAKIL